MIVELPLLRLFPSNIWQNWRVVSLLFRWDGKDHHLPLNICSVDLWDCSLVSWMLFWWIPRTCLCMWSQSPASAFFPWLSCLEMPGHYRLRFLEFVFLFPAMCICSLIFYFFFSFQSLLPDFFSVLSDSYHLSQLPCQFSRGISPLPTMTISLGWDMQLTIYITCLKPRSQQSNVN